MIKLLRKILLREITPKEDVFLSLPNSEKKKILERVSREADQMQAKIVEKYNYLFVKL